MSFLAFFGMFKNRAAWYVVAGVLCVFGLLAWHFSSVHRAVLNERARMEAVNAVAIKAAIDTQAAQNTTAATEFATGAIERDTQIIYLDKEVTKYVKQNNTLTHRGGDDCRVDTGFISVFDGTSTAAKPAN